MKHSKRILLCGAVFFAQACSQVAIAQPGGSVQIIQPVTKDHCALYKETNQNYLYDNGPCAVGGVSSFNTRTGVVTLTSGDVTGALGYTPPANSITVTGTGALTGGGDLTANRTINIAAITADSVLMNATGGSAVPSGVAVPNCATALTYNTTTHAYGCGAGGGVTSFNTRTGAVTLSGADVSGVGGLISTNNLSDVTTPATALTNIGGIGAATTNTLTNKTYDTAGAGNTFKINGTTISSLSGNTSKVATLTGSTATNDCASFDASGNLQDLNSLGCGLPGLANLVATSQSPTAAMWKQCKYYGSITASLTFTLPSSTTPLDTNGCIGIVTTQTATLALANASDKINGGSAGVSATLQPGNYTILTDGANNFTTFLGTSASGLANPITVAVTDTYAGAASSPQFLFSVAPFSGGSGTTTFPTFFWQWGGATAVTTWNTAGTILGVNTPSGWTGNLLDFWANDTTELFLMDPFGGFTASGSILSGGFSKVGAKNASVISSPSGTDGVMMVSNNAETNFTRLDFGGTTTAFPGLQRNSAELDAELADGSAKAAFGAQSFVLEHAFATQATPTISSGFGSSPSVVAHNGTNSFTINVGTGGAATSGVVAMNATAATGWACKASDITTHSTAVAQTIQTATSTTTVTFTQYSDVMVATAWAASDVLQVNCDSY